MKEDLYKMYVKQYFERIKKDIDEKIQKLYDGSDKITEAVE